MSVESTSQVMNDYLDALLKQEDFARYFADDIAWTTTETGDEVRGRDAVRDLIVVAATGAQLRVPYCVCYDVAGDQITALRAYMPISLMLAQVKAAADTVATS